MGVSGASSCATRRGGRRRDPPARATVRRVPADRAVLAGWGGVALCGVPVDMEGATGVNLYAVHIDALWPCLIVAETPGKAKYEALLAVQDAGYERTFADMHCCVRFARNVDGPARTVRLSEDMGQRWHCLLDRIAEPHAVIAAFRKEMAA